MQKLTVAVWLTEVSRVASASAAQTDVDIRRSSSSSSAITTRGRPEVHVPPILHASHGIGSGQQVAGVVEYEDGAGVSSIERTRPRANHTRLEFSDVTAVLGHLRAVIVIRFRSKPF